ncbi:carbamoyltransferase HypF [archaeon]|nr:MAG: carbamoyltransferase HypF [archaeon]
MLILRIFGTVQGVGFRPFIWRLATSEHLTGYVLNKGGYVEVALEGDTSHIESFVSRLPKELPPRAHIDSIERDRVEDAQFSAFTIRHSESSHSSLPSGIPPDITLCDKCRDELFTSGDRRHHYPFINCTDCGPRFTIVSRVPYDRVHTTMQQFPMCERCREEYESPRDRRYHAEPIACPVCGPHYALLSRGGKQHAGPIAAVARLIDNGEIVAIKGYGGFHIACDATSETVLAKLRTLLERPYQPFALMARDSRVLDGELEVDADEHEHLTSPAAPIVVLERTASSTLPPSVAPGLSTIGVVLPYAPIHYLLFSHLSTPFVVMTSANYPGNPMITTFEDARSRLGCIDHFLTHDLTIMNRCDDSVVRNNKFIRRSRGFVPSTLPIPSSRTLLALGAELNNVVALSKNGHCMLSQHIGDTSNWSVMEVGIDAIERMFELFDLSFDRIDHIICDMHPHYTTSRVARTWSRDEDVPLIEVQHHKAHCYALVAEHGIDEMLCVSADGMGYGEDGTIWGGELFYTDGSSTHTERLAHLENVPLPGGDRATYHPLRMLIPFLDDDAMVRYAHHFPRGMDEIGDIRKTMHRSPVTSSCGRILDAVAAMLELSVKRTYEGEGPMRLESLAMRGYDLGVPIEVEGDTILTSPFMQRLHDLMGRARPQDIAMTAHVSLARAFADACAAHDDLHVPVGFTGGVAINKIMSDILRIECERRGVQFFEHRKVPPGDGGISYGQSCMRDL